MALNNVLSRKVITGNLKALDSLRGIAAVYVLVGHARWLLWEGYNEGYLLHQKDYSFFDKACMYFFTIFKFGHEAVLFFFVLSGFVIHWSVSKKRDKANKLVVSDYLYRRYRRIFPPLLLAIALTFILDKTGMFCNLQVYFSHTPYSSINENIHPQFGLTTLAGNLLFLQTVYTPVWGTDGPLWSLMYEWWFYMLYIPVSWLYARSRLLTSVLVFVLWVLNMEWHFEPLLLSKVLGYFLAWYFGMLLADFLLYEKIQMKLAVGYLSTIMATCLFRYYNGLGREIGLAIVIVIILYMILTVASFSWLKRIHSLGAFSYTLYVIHLPLICLISGFVMRLNKGYLPAHSLFIPLGISISLITAWLFHFLTERPFVLKRDSS